MSIYKDKTPLVEAAWLAYRANTRTLKPKQEAEAKRAFFAGVVFLNDFSGALYGICAGDKAKFDAVVDELETEVSAFFGPNRPRMEVITVPPVGERN